MLLSQLFETPLKFNKSIIINGNSINLSSMDEFFMLSTLLINQTVNLTTFNNEEFLNVIMRGSFSRSNGPNSWLNSGKEKIRCQEFKQISVKSLDKSKMIKMIEKVSEQLEIDAVIIGQYDNARNNPALKNLPPTRSPYEQSFLKVLKSLEFIVGKLNVADKKFLLPASKTLQ